MPTLFPDGYPGGFAPATATQLPIDASPSTRFALRLLTKLGPGKSNLVISKYGARVLLSLLWAGASGDTQREMAEVLGLTRPGNDARKWYEEAGRPTLRAFVDREKGEEFQAATCVWCDKHLSIHEAYAQTVCTDYLASVKSADFTLPSSADAVNSWVREHTCGQISSIVNEMKTNSPMLAVNALYFRGRWCVPFEASETREEDFFLPDGRAQRVQMMRQSRHYMYAERKGAQVVELSYSGGARMLVFLPPKGEVLSDWCMGMPEVLGPGWRRQFSERPGELRMPRFRIESDSSFVEALRALGMRRALLPESAEFGGISPVAPFYLREVRQKGLVEVNEEGTIAAAATYADEALAALPPPPPPPFRMIVDRPFAFAICDARLDAILFLGTVVNPVAR